MVAAASSVTEDTEQIRALIESVVKAVRAKDVDAVLRHYTPDVVAFDLAPPLQYAGAAALRESLAAWFPTFDGPVGYEMRDLRIFAGQEVAFCTGLNRIAGRRTNGDETDVWVRATVGLRKIDGRWLVAHEHASVPFYMDGSYRAAVDLAP